MSMSVSLFRTYRLACDLGFSSSGINSNSSRFMSLLVVADASSLQASCRAINAANLAFGASSGTKDPSLSVLVCGSPDDSKALDDAAALFSKVCGVSEVLMAKSDALKHNLPAPMAALVTHVIKTKNFENAAAPNGTFARDFMPRAAALLDSPLIADVVDTVDAKTFTRPSYAGNAMETVERTGDGPTIVTFRPTAFDAAETNDTNAAPVVQVSDDALAAAAGSTSLGEFVSAENKDTGERADLSTARVVISGGRGVGDNFDKLYSLADAFGPDAAVGASRAAVDAGMCANDMQVGQTGKVVAPEVYIALGISGAIQHVAGMKDSKVIVAVNKDEDCPLFSIADVGYTGDLFEAVDRIKEEVQKKKA